MEKEIGILEQYDSLDVDDLIVKIEKSFAIRFNETDFSSTKTNGDFEMVILSKFNGEGKNDCTSQQAFYKLRTIVSENFEIEKNDIKLKTKLDEIFPK